MTRKSAAMNSAVASAAQEQKSKEKLLKATLELLAGGCLHTISIRDISLASDVNSAMVSYYFGSKEQLYAAIVKQQFDEYQQQVVTTFKADGDARDNLRAACAAIADFHASHPHFLLLYFRELTNPSASYESIILPCIGEAAQKATDMVQAGIEQGVFKPDTRPRYVVQSLIGMVNYCFMTNRLHRDLQIEPSNEMPDYVDYALQMVLHHIAVK